jgi:outer membrane lipoprotein-sorting protein
MKKITFLLFILLAFLAVTDVKAQDAKKILDKSAAAFTKAGNVKIGFSANVNGNNAGGTICVSGNKFQLNTGDLIIWFDGKSMWNYVVVNDEVNVSHPSAKEVARMNPYSFLTLYKKGYDCSMGKSSSSEYEVILKGQKGSAYNRITVRMSKKSYQPTYIKTEAKSTMEIKVNSFASKQNFPASTFTFDKKKYPNAEIVDLR